MNSIVDWAARAWASTAAFSGAPMSCENGICCSSCTARVIATPQCSALDVEQRCSRRQVLHGGTTFEDLTDLDNGDPTEDRGVEVLEPVLGILRRHRCGHHAYGAADLEAVGKSEEKELSSGHECSSSQTWADPASSSE